MEYIKEALDSILEEENKKEIDAELYDDDWTQEDEEDFNTYDEDEVMLTSLDNGAIDVEKDDENYDITTTPEDMLKVKDALEKMGVENFLESEVTYLPNMEVEVDDEHKEKVLELIEQLEDLDDVQSVYFNMKD